LLDIEFGFEIWTGGQGMAVNSFSATVTRSRSAGAALAPE